MKGKEMLAVVGISAVVDKTFDKAVVGAQKKISKISPKALKVATAIGGIATAAGGAGKKLLEVGSAYQKTMGQLQAKTGATAGQMKQLGKVVQSVYKNNFGESVDDVAVSISEVQRIMKLPQKELQAVTESAISLRDVFDYDVAESARAAEAIIKNFGTTGQEAYNLIAAGAQKGLDYSGELLDSISEYSVQFKKIGFDANDMFNLFQQGAESGAWNLDKVGDAVKEFSIRAIDGSDKTVGAYQKLGLNAEKVMAKFAEGGEGARTEFAKVTQKLMDVNDKVARDAIGVALFGTMWEDLGTDAVEALSKVNDQAFATGQEMKNLQKAKYTNLGDAFQGIGRVIEVSVLPIANKLANKIAEYQPEIEKAVNAAVAKVSELLPYVAKAGSFIKDHINQIIPVVISLGSAIGMLKFAKMAKAAVDFGKKIKGLHLIMKAQTAMTKAAVVAQKAWTVAKIAGKTAARGLGLAIKFMTGPIGLAITAFAAIVTAGVLVYKNWDKIKRKAIEIGGKIKGVFSSMKNGVVAVFQKMRDKIGAIMGGLASIVKKPINAVLGIVNKMIDTVNNLSFDIPDWVPGIGGDTVGFNIPHLQMLEQGGLTSGPSIAGEGRYPEMVISQDPRWRSQNISNWQQAGRMLGATDPNYRIAGDRSTTTVDMGSINYAPVINVQGNADRTEILKALQEDRENFKDILREMFEEIQEYVYA